MKDRDCRNRSCGEPKDKWSQLSLQFSTDDCPCSGFPAAGYRNNSNGGLNNAGSNGNYWYGSPNSATNGYNLNFNSTNLNTSNNNNRAYGFSVRCVSELTDSVPHSFHLTKEQLLLDLYLAYKDAGKNKRGKYYYQEFTLNMEDELVSLRDELWNRTYKPGNSMCFIVKSPKKREVFAASFRDRVVHHLYYNYTYLLFNNTFIHDSYSCREEKGTLFGIDRLVHHIRSVSDNYAKPCYVMKMDIEGYFMHIDRYRLLGITIDTLKRMSTHQSDEPDKTWSDKLDYDFLYYLTEVIIMYNPVDNCFIHGSANDWVGLPRSKSLFFTPLNCGLPIGNLTSQLFSNVYLNVLDQFMKRTLHCRNYGRYVDDFYVVMNSKEALKSLIPQIRSFLKDNLMLTLHTNKTMIIDVRQGVGFLGAYVKPYRRYIESHSWKRMHPKILNLTTETNVFALRASLNSFLGILNHYNEFNRKYAVITPLRHFYNSGFFTGYMNKFIPATFSNLHNKS